MSDEHRRLSLLQAGALHLPKGHLMGDKPMIVITDANDQDHITLNVDGGQSVTVHNDPSTVADAIHQINNPE